jgi:hypothetical protein
VGADHDGRSPALRPGLIGAGRDVQSIYALQHVDGTTTVYFDRIRCATRAWDVFAVVDP